MRPKGERFEVVAGARRFRAAQIAELADVPTRILELSDEQTVEIQIVENAQRQDVQCYEEATGYQRLLDLTGDNVTALASKCGTNQSHLYARLSLLQLIPDIAEAFQQERVTANHANLIARLTPEQQAEAFKNCFRKDWQDKDVTARLQVERRLELILARFSVFTYTLLSDRMQGRKILDGIAGKATIREIYKQALLVLIFDFDNAEISHGLAFPLAR